MGTKPPFFPDPVFGWIFYLVLVGITVLASWTDLRTLAIPKWLTVPALVLGVLINVIRGAWLGLLGPDRGAPEVWLFQNPGPWLGALDGLLFSLAGFGLGFGLFLVMYLLGTCKGGDVKLFGALGAWVGPWNALYLLIGTILFVIVLSVVRLIWTAFSRGTTAAVKDYSVSGAAKAGKRAGQQGYVDARQTRRRLMAYSLPVALSTALILAWVFRHDLGLVPRQPANTATTQVPAHA